MGTFPVDIVVAVGFEDDFGEQILSEDHFVCHAYPPPLLLTFFFNSLRAFDLPGRTKLIERHRRALLPIILVFLNDEDPFI